MPCPKCAYLNDDTYNFCEKCVYRKEPSLLTHTPSLNPPNLDAIEERLRELHGTRMKKPYEKQKSALHRELLDFLACLPTPKSLASACADDIVKFLVWKDKAGRTTVHHLACPEVGKKSCTCGCPKRLAAGTVDSLIGKLRSIFNNNGLGGEWDDRLGVGNPVSHPAIKNYLKLIKEEQAKSRVLPSKAVPIFMNKLEILAQHLLAQLRNPNCNAISLYVLSFQLNVRR